MVLRCSLLGHDYGDPEVEREREERGSEVVVTVQEYEECSRCGNRHIISENTEVTSLPETNADSPTPPDTDPEPTPEQPTAPAETATAAGTDGEIIDTDAVRIQDAETEASTESDSEVDPEYPTDDDGEPVTDDGEILDDEPPADREHGEWPASDDTGPPVTDDDPTAWPDTEPEDDAVVLEHTDPTASSGHEAVATDSEIVDGGPTSSEPAPDSGSGIERAEPVPTPGETGRRRDDDVPTEFYCPRCEFVESDSRGSLRAGDICPNCRRGYLGERPIQ